jgi:hypothetical protein
MERRMTLEERLIRRLQEWRKLARRYRVAQDECEDQSDEWHLNKENKEMLYRCIDELAADLGGRNETPKVARSA